MYKYKIDIDNKIKFIGIKVQGSDISSLQFKIM